MLNTYHSIRDADGYEYNQRNDEPRAPVVTGTPKRRHWSRETRDSIGTGVRMPKPLYKRLHAYIECTGNTVTDVILWAVDGWLREHSPVDRQIREEGGAGVEA